MTEPPKCSRCADLTWHEGELQRHAERRIEAERRRDAEGGAMTLTIAEADARLAPIATIKRVESRWRKGTEVRLVAEARASAQHPSITGIEVSAQSDSLDGCCAEIERLITGRPGAVDTEGGR